MPLTIEAEFRKAAASGKLKKVIYLIQKKSNLNINASGPKSGRTALHWAAAKEQTKVLAYLIKIGADLSCKDLAGFTAHELAVNPIAFTSPPSNHFFGERCCLLDNIEKDLKAYDCLIVYVRNTLELEDYITENPYVNKIGFILDCPNILKAVSSSIHVLPIFFERQTNREIFTILDSAYIYFIPLKTKEGFKRKIIFNPFIRQASDKGCFREAVLVLIHCFFDKNLFNFCNSNSISFIISEAPTNEELILLQTNLPKTADEMLKMSIILSRFNFEKMQRMGFKASSLVSNVQCLTAIPQWMFLYIEHYRLMRDLKNSEEGGYFLIKIAFDEHISLNSRYKGISRDLLIDNFNSLDKRFDFNTYRHKEAACLPITKQDIKRILMLTEKLNRVTRADNLLSETKNVFFKQDKVLSSEGAAISKVNARNLLGF